MNSVNLIGRITKDPEIRQSSGGRTFVPFTLAVSSFSNGKEYTQFIPCFAWEKTAEIISNYVKKGNKIGVEGSINARSENKDGNYTTIVTVNVNRVHFLENKGGNSQDKSQDNNFDFSENPVFDADDSILWD